MAFKLLNMHVIIIYFNFYSTYFLQCSYELMDKANSRFRIGLSVTVMVWCFLGSVYSIMKGKEAAAENRDSIYQKNRERHSRAKRADE